jgi:hypothetical protein
VDNHVTEGGVTRPIVESNVDPAQPTAVTVPTSHLSKTGNLVASLAGRQTEILPNVDRAVEDTDTVKAWKAAVNNIDWVMRTVDPIVKVCPMSFFLYDLLSNFCPSAGCQLSIESALKDSRGTCPCLALIWNIHTFYRLVDRLWETSFSVMKTPESCSRRYEMRSNLEMKRIF